jgi:anthranilate phosphoribosyltransferase
VVGLRNPGHSVVKLMQPGLGHNLVISSYTHPAYAESMAETFALLRMNALLSRGLEGESVADPRRMAQVDGFIQGERIELQTQQAGTLSEVPGLPEGFDLATTVDYTRRVLDGALPVPDAIARQVRQVLLLAMRLKQQAPAPSNPHLAQPA